MKLKKAAVLGLSTLVLGSNMILPVPMANGSTVWVSNMHIAQVQSSNEDFLQMAAEQQEAQKQGKEMRYSFWKKVLRPFAFLAGKTTRVAYIPETANIPIAPISPTADINPARTVSTEATASEPAVQAAPADQADVKEPAREAEAQTSGASAKKPVYKQVFPQPQTEQAEKPAAPQKFERLFPTNPSEYKPEPKQVASTAPGNALQLKAPSPAEYFQMLTTAGLEGLQDLSGVPGTSNSYRVPIAPSFGDSPDVAMYSGGSDVTVLKSGISQKVTDVDLTLGKAQVIQLSRPASRVAVSNPDIASAVIITPTQIQLVGKSVGVSNLLIWGDMNSPNHTVVDISVHRDVSVLVNQLKYVDPGIQIAPMAAEDTVILMGQAESRESAQLAIELAKAYFAKNNSTGAAPAGGGNQAGPNSRMPGSALPGAQTNLINLIKVKGEPSTKIELVRQKLREIDPNISLEVVPGPDGNEKVILTGRVPSASIASKALNMASVFYGEPGIKLVTAQGGNEYTRLNPNAGGSLAGSSGSGGGNSGGAGGGQGGRGTLNASVNILQGSILTDNSGNVISMLEVAQKPQIRCSIKFLEINKNDLDAIGGTLTGAMGDAQFSHMSGAQSAAPGREIANIDPSGTGNIFNSTRDAIAKTTTANGQSLFAQAIQNGVTQMFTIDQRFTAAIQAMEERSKARNLAEPTLTMLSGEPGSFLAGGEIPIAVAGANGSVSIEYHEFGVRLNLIATVTDDGKIQMQVAPEVSSVDNANRVTSTFFTAPAFTTRRMQSTLLVNDNQSFVLAGLFRQEDVNSVSRFPGVGSLPIIGNFFRNKWKSRRNTELVVVIKPEIMMSPTGNTSPNAISQKQQPGLQILQQPQVTEETKPAVSQN